MKTLDIKYFYHYRRIPEEGNFGDEHYVASMEEYECRLCDYKTKLPTGWVDTKSLMEHMMLHHLLELVESA